MMGLLLDRAVLTEFGLSFDCANVAHIRTRSNVVDGVEIHYWTLATDTECDTIGFLEQWEWKQASSLQVAAVPPLKYAGACRGFE